MPKWRITERHWAVFLFWLIFLLQMVQHPATRSFFMEKPHNGGVDNHPH